MKVESKMEDNVLRFRVSIRTGGVSYPYNLMEMNNRNMDHITDDDLKSLLEECRREASDCFLDKEGLRVLLSKIVSTGVTPKLCGHISEETWRLSPLKNILGLFEVINPYIEDQIKFTPIKI